MREKGELDSNWKAVNDWREVETVREMQDGRMKSLLKVAHRLQEGTRMGINQRTLRGRMEMIGEG